MTPLFFRPLLLASRHGHDGAPDGFYAVRVGWELIANICNNRILPIGIKNRRTIFRLDDTDFMREFETFLQQSNNLAIDSIDGFAEMGDIGGWHVEALKK